MKAATSALRIINDESPLRGAGDFVSPMNWPPKAESNLPRALRALSRIIEGGLCHRCGTCIGICPTAVLGLDEEEYPKVVSLSSCTDCDLCVRVCPGDEFDFNALKKQTFGVEGEIKETHGEFSESFIAYATDADIRERSTSGGVVSALLLDLLENKQIDGAVVITSDAAELWKGKPIMARSRQEILSAMKSKYAISPTNAVLAEVWKTPGRYALVGLPCQIHGFIKAANLDARIKERVVLTIGLFCHAAIEHEGLRTIWGSLGDKRDQAQAFVSRVGKHPGTPYLELKDGSMYPVYFGEKKGYRPSSMEMINILYRLYTPSRCMTCFDASAEFADIAVGDPWMAPPDESVDFYKGWSFALVRSERGRMVCQAAKEAGKLVIKPVTRKEALACNSLMATEKRWRAFRVMETQKRQGKPIPAYGPFDFTLPHQSGTQFVKTELHMLSHIFCYLPKARSRVLKLMLSSVGYTLLWLNSFRRGFRFFRRDFFAALRRRIFGRT